MLKPSPSTYPAYFQKYVDQVADENLFVAFTNQKAVIDEFLSSISEQRSLYAYAEGKWTLKEVLQHLIDAERIFCYRALCFARKDRTSLPGFDENDYADNSHANYRTWQSLSEEFLAVRKATEMLFKSFTTEALQTSGVANNNPTSVIAMGFITIGHFAHHKRIVDERY